MRLVPKDWSRFQHYKNRRPPWIKLHRELLDDRDFMSMSLAGKALAPLVWLLASESEDGTVDSTMLAWRLRWQQSDIDDALKSLCDAGLLLDASTMLAPCLQHAIPEERRDRERDRDRPEEKGASVPGLFGLSGHVPDKSGHSGQKQQRVAERPDDVPQELWDDWIAYRRSKKAPFSESALKAMRREAEKDDLKLQDAIQATMSAGWQGFIAGRRSSNRGAPRPSEGHGYIGVVPKVIPPGYYDDGLDENGDPIPKEKR